MNIDKGNNNGGEGGGHGSTRTVLGLVRVGLGLGSTLWVTVGHRPPSRWPTVTHEDLRSRNVLHDHPLTAT